MTEVFLRPRAWANLLKSEQGKYRYCLMSTGADGICFPDRTAYACEPRTTENAKEMDEVMAEATVAMASAGFVLVRELDKAERSQRAHAAAYERGVQQLAAWFSDRFGGRRG